MLTKATNQAIEQIRQALRERQIARAEAHNQAVRESREAHNG